jgi:flagellar basal body-associated protein FliL
MDDDNDNLYFSFDDEEEEEGVEAEESQNRAFLIGAIILAAVFVLGICAIVIFFVIKPSNLVGGGGGVSDIELTNSANMTLAAATQTAAFEALQATETPIEEPTEIAEVTEEVTAPSPTPTSLIQVTPLTSGTQTAEAEEGQGGGEATAEGTSEIIVVTPLGGEEEEATPTSRPTGVGGPIGATSEFATPTPRSGGAIEPQAAATLPQTGFSGGVGFAGAGLLAVALVAVIVITRRIRMK